MSKMDVVFLHIQQEYNRIVVMNMIKLLFYVNDNAVTIMNTRNCRKIKCLFFNVRYGNQIIFGDLQKV